MQWPAETGKTPSELLNLAKQASAHAYAPYSGFSVGAALLCRDGRIYTGCNIENASYGLTICAERNALAKGVSEDMSCPVAIAVVGASGKPCYPCGACRQVLAEFNPAMAVVLEDSDGPRLFSLSELFPHPFLKEPQRGEDECF
ncbi:MAG: cytidine deaminase [Thermovirgaceae bacterium]